MTRSGSAEHAGGWQRVSVVATSNQVDLAVDVLWSSGAHGIEEQPRAHGQTLLAGFDDETAASTAVAGLRRLGFDEITVTAITDTGLDGWRAFAAPVAAGPFWLVPTWTPPPPEVDPDRLLWIEPGPTFGSGSHATTRLVVASLAEVARSGDRVIDVGCGSGVLAIAAARLGAASVVGIDIDPACEDVLIANAVHNEVDAQVRWSAQTIAGLAAAGAEAEVVVANLLAPVIVEHGEALRALVAPGGVLVVSGLLEDRWEATMPALAPWAPTRVTTDDGWVAVALKDPGGRGR